MTIIKSVLHLVRDPKAYQYIDKSCMLEKSKGKYTCKEFNGLSCIFILDGFITQGSTLAEIHRACLVSNPSVKVIALALAKHVHLGYSKAKDVNNSYIPEEWEAYWTEGNK